MQNLFDSVAVADVNAPNAELVAKGIVADGGRAIAIEADVSEPTQVEAMVSRTVQEFGALHILYNNAGVMFPGAIDTYDLDKWHVQWSVNVTGPLLCSKFAIPHLKKDGGAIVNTASTAGLKASPRESVYGISKAALIQLTKSVARDHAAEGIRSNCICPGFLESVMSDRGKDMSDELLAKRRERASGLVPLGREGRYDEVARAVLFLADSAESSYITGASLVIDGGFTLV